MIPPSSSESSRTTLRVPGKESTALITSISFDRATACACACAEGGVGVGAALTRQSERESKVVRARSVLVMNSIFMVVWACLCEDLLMAKLDG